MSALTAKDLDRRLQHEQAARDRRVLEARCPASSADHTRKRSMQGIENTAASVSTQGSQARLHPRPNRQDVHPSSKAASTGEQWQPARAPLPSVLAHSDEICPTLCSCTVSRTAPYTCAQQHRQGAVRRCQRLRKRLSGPKHAQHTNHHELHGGRGNQTAKHGLHKQPFDLRRPRRHIER